MGAADLKITGVVELKRGRLYDFVNAIVNYSREHKVLLRFLRKYHGGLEYQTRILDVGCGFGGLLSKLLELKYDALGVDVNPEALRSNQARGLPCTTVEALLPGDPPFDAILMAHVIEHFPPEALLKFIDSYLDRLKPGGHLVICTPFVTPYFYNDFDHVRSYNPRSIIEVFGADALATQVQYHSRNRIALKDLWIRRSYYRFTYVRGKNVKCWSTYLLMGAEFVSMTANIMSGGWIGKKDGWVGVFEKLP